MNQIIEQLSDSVILDNYGITGLKLLIIQIIATIFGFIVKETLSAIFSLGIWNSNSLLTLVITKIIVFLAFAVDVIVMGYLARRLWGWDKE